MFHDLDILHNAEGILLIASVILFFSIFAGKAGYRFGLPALLLFLGVGMLFGSDGLGIQFSNPNAAQFIGMLALSIILFSGGMDTKISEVKPIAPQGVILATIGVLATTFITGGFHLLLVQTGHRLRDADTSGVAVDGGRHVVNRFGLRILYPAKQRGIPERTASSDIGVGKW